MIKLCSLASTSTMLSDGPRQFWRTIVGIHSNGCLKFLRSEGQSTGWAHAKLGFYLIMCLWLVDTGAITYTSSSILSELRFSPWSLPDLCDFIPDTGDLAHDTTDFSPEASVWVNWILLMCLSKLLECWFYTMTSWFLKYGDCMAYFGVVMGAGIFSVFMQSIRLKVWFKNFCSAFGVWDLEGVACMGLVGDRLCSDRLLNSPSDGLQNLYFSSGESRKIVHRALLVYTFASSLLDSFSFLSSVIFCSFFVNYLLMNDSFSLNDVHDATWDIFEPWSSKESARDRSHNFVILFNELFNLGNWDGRFNFLSDFEAAFYLRFRLYDFCKQVVLLIGLFLSNDELCCYTRLCL